MPRGGLEECYDALVPQGEGRATYQLGWTPRFREGFQVQDLVMQAPNSNNADRSAPIFGRGSDLWSGNGGK